MWKRIQGQPKKEHATIGSPTLVDTTYDNRLLKRASTLSPSPTPVIGSSDFPSRSPSPRDYRVSQAPTVTSVYSQESVEDTKPVEKIDNISTSVGGMRNRSLSPFHHISEQDSRKTSPIVSPGSGASLSPDDANGQGKKSYFSSHIPTLRRSMSNMVKNGGPKPPNKNTRWDEYSGEPTTSASGKPSQVKPGTQSDAFERAQTNGYQVTITGPEEKVKKNAFAERAAKMGRDALVLDTRPSWRGGSGRSAGVDPTTENRQYTAVKSTSGLSNDDSMNGSNSDSSLVLEQSESKEPSPVSPIGGHFDDFAAFMRRPDLNRQVSDAQSISPVSTLKPKPNYPVSASNTLRNTPSVRTISRKPIFSPVLEPEKVRATVGKNDPQSNTSTAATPEQQPKSHFSWTTFAESEADARSTHTVGRRTLTDPPSNSRFSWTTVNTATTYQQDSPPPSPPSAPMPRMSSLMSRGRPVPSHNKPPTPPPTKFDMYHVGQNVSITNGMYKRTDSICEEPTNESDESDIKTEEPAGKALPLPPGVSRSMSHVDTLIAQRDDLAYRHRSIQRVIEELQQIELASPMVVDQKTRRANKKKLDEHTTRLEEVERQEHEVGRNLARVRRKIEREQGMDSGLWVRRVTG